MGIPGFASWLKQRYPQAFGELKPGEHFDNIYIDLQSTLHVVTRKSRSKHGFHITLHRRLDELLKTLGPSKRVVFAMDGPAPLAKLLEQRRRRRREAHRLESEDDDDVVDDTSISFVNDGTNTGAPDHDQPLPSIVNPSPALTSGGADDGLGEAALKRPPQSKSSREKQISAISPLFLTPGTLFMLEVHNSLQTYICTRLARPSFRHVHFELSDSTVKGEGELKILSRLVQAEMDGRRSESHAVVGADSDLLLMTIISGCANVVVCDDRPLQQKPVRGGSGSRSGRHKGTRHHRPGLFKENSLMHAWRKEGSLGEHSTQEDFQMLSLDLALLAILSSGNDYLPACQGLQLRNKSRPGLWNLYLDMRRQPEWKGQSLVHRLPLTANPNHPHRKHHHHHHHHQRYYPVKAAVGINRVMLAALLQRFSIQRGAPLGNGSGSSSRNFDEIEGCWTFAQDASAPPPAPPYLGYVNRLPADPSKYLHGLEWVLSMYVTGSIEDYRYSYPAASPQLFSFIEYLEEASGGQQAAQEGVLGASTATKDERGEEEEELNRRPGGSSDAMLYSHRSSPVGPEANFNNHNHNHNHNSPLVQPLIPVACALALLPARSRRQAASPLRHLMDADSPIAEIYAVCKECTRLATDIRSVATELDAVRKELGTLQDKLTAAALDSEGALEAEADLTSAVERWEGAGEKLRDLLRGLSKSQQEHLMEKHPYKPFPTEELEAAVGAVPHEMYAPWERKLAQFGREMLFKLAEEAETVSVVGAATEREPLLPPPPNDYNNNADDASELMGAAGSTRLPGWLRDCTRFATNYPRVAKVQDLRGAATTVAREILPLHPYMQPGLGRGGAALRKGFKGVQGAGFSSFSRSSEKISEDRTPPAACARCSSRFFRTRGFSTQVHCNPMMMINPSGVVVRGGGVKEAVVGATGVNGRRMGMVQAVLLTCSRVMLPRLRLLR